MGDVNLLQVVSPQRLWEARGSRLPLRGVIRHDYGQLYALALKDAPVIQLCKITINERIVMLGAD